MRQIGSPAVRTMVDCSAAGRTEAEPIPDLLRRWLPTGLIAHIHFNDPNRRGPGEGDLAFAPILAGAARRRLRRQRVDRAVHLRARRSGLRGARHRLRPRPHARHSDDARRTTPAPRRGELVRAAGETAPAVPVRRHHADRSAAGVRARPHQACGRARRRRHCGRAAGAEVVRQVAGALQRGELSPAATLARARAPTSHRRRQPTPCSVSPPLSSGRITPPARPKTSTGSSPRSASP